VELQGGDGVVPRACVAAACPAGTNVLGGAAGNNSVCPGSSGIRGGNAACPHYPDASYAPPDATKDGAPGATWTMDSASSGGCGSHATEAGFPFPILTVSGGDGYPGLDGAFGDQGTGCQDGLGTFAAGVWVAAAASGGGSGISGVRGGTGASSGGIDSADAARMPAGVGAYGGAYQHKVGGTGGGAGAGACGGTGGGKGGAGGAVLAVAIAFTNLTGIALPPELAGNLVQRGAGGNGGNGGFGGRGGVGGSGGRGGVGSGYWIDFRAGNGGKGGDGGTGGGGGGGCGGASFGIVVLGPDAAWTLDYGAANSFVQPESALTGGIGGQPGPTGNANGSADGVDGATKNYYVQ
jgi:hypothetical protein